MVNSITLLHRKKLFLLLVFLGLVCGTLHAQDDDGTPSGGGPGGGVDPDCVERAFLIDFGSPSMTTTTTESTWQWNNVANSVAGTNVNLITRCGEDSDVAVQIINSSDDGYGGITGNQFNTGGYNGEVMGYPASACVDSHFSYLTGGTYKLTGLLPDHFYTITIFGSRMVAATDRVGTYTFNKKQKTLDAANNTSQTITFYYLKPNTQGELALDFGVAPGSQFGYLNVMHVMETGDPSITAPATLSSQVTSTNGVLNWTDNSTNEQGFRIERKLTSQNVFQVVGTVPANTTQFTDTNLAPGSYDYRVFAYGEAFSGEIEESAFSNETSLLITPPVGERRFLIDFGDPATPATVAGWNNVSNSITGTTVRLVTSQGIQSVIDIVILKNSDDGYGGITGNQFNSGGFNGTVLDYPASACRDSHFSFGTGGKYKITNLNPNRYYTIRIFGSRDVVGTDRKGTYAFNGKQLILDAASNTSQTILFHYLKPSEESELLLDFGVAPGSSFGYLNVMDIQETRTPTIKEPLSLQESRNGLSINLSWTDNSTNESGFKVERRVVGTPLFQEVGQVGPGVTNFSDTVAENAAGYEYRVFAFKNDENSAYSNSVNTGGLSSAAPSVPNDLQRFVSGETVTLRWVNTTQNNNYSGVRIERRLLGGSFELAGEVGPGIMWFSDTLNLSSPADTYEYRIYAYNAVGNSVYSSSVYVENFRTPTSEFIALKALYDNVGGDAWTRKTNWPETGGWPAYPNAYEYSTWEGVSVNNVFLNALELNNNNLTGIIPMELWRARDLWYFRAANNNITGFAEGMPGLTGMSSFYEIDLSHNQLSILPDYLGALPNLNRLILHHNQLEALPQTFASHQQIVDADVSNNDLNDLPDFSGNEMLRSLNIANNHFTFAVLENVVDWGIENLTYAPQKKFKSNDSTSFALGQPLVLQAVTPGQFSSITWEKQQPDGTWISINQLDQDSELETFTRNSAGEIDAGFYRWRMTNSKVQGLELECEPIEVQKMGTVQYDSLVVLNSVGIGRSTPNGYSLAIAGKAIASGLNLKIARQWPDYVFQPEYRLMSLNEVAAFVKKYGHLPGIPSAARVAADVNYNVSAMDLTLLEKIEELTLYLLQLNKAVEGNKSDMPLSTSFNKVSGAEDVRLLQPSEKYVLPVGSTSMHAVHVGNIMVTQSLAVGLSRPMPEGYHMAVGGNIIATGLDLKAPNNWPDYVFADDYNLPSLKALRHYIRKHGHLPGLPSAPEISANGIYSMAEMDTKLLEKIEELTLYMIQLSGIQHKGQEVSDIPAEDQETKLLTSSGVAEPAPADASEDVQVLSTIDADSLEFEQVIVRKALSIASPRAVPTNYKLAVGGSIIAAGMDLKPSQKWPDYVFEPGYKLLAMDELANYIREHGHLPGLPSAADMNKKGDYNTAEMDVKILEKIEELTLYILALDAGVRSK